MKQRYCQFTGCGKEIPQVWADGHPKSASSYRAQKFCCREHAFAARSVLQLPVRKICDFCKTEFPRPKNLSNKLWMSKRFCCIRCANQSRGKKAPKHVCVIPDSAPKTLSEILAKVQRFHPQAYARLPRFGKHFLAELQQGIDAENARGGDAYAWFYNRYVCPDEALIGNVETLALELGRLRKKEVEK